MEIIVVSERHIYGNPERHHEDQRWGEVEKAIKDMIKNGIRPVVGDVINIEGFCHKDNLPHIYDTDWIIKRISYVYGDEEPVLFVVTD